MEEKSLTSPEVEKAIAERLKLEGQLKGGASWFYWIAGLSILNMALAVANQPISFPVGLGSTSFLALLEPIAVQYDSILAGPLRVAHPMFAILLSAMFAFIGYKARQGNSRVYLTGMVLYVADGLVSALLQLWLIFVFHAIALVGLWAGYNALRKFQRLRPPAAKGG